MKKNVFNILMSIIIIIYVFLIYIILFKTEYPSPNIPYGPVPLILGLTLMMIMPMLLCKAACCKDGYKKEYLYNRMFFWGLFLMGLLSISLAYYDYKESITNSSNLNVVDGYFEGKKQYVNGRDIQITTFVYSYEVYGEKYLLTTGATKKVPRKGSKKKIVYNPINPTDARLYNNPSMDNNDIFFLILGSVFALVGLIALIKQSINRYKVLRNSKFVV